MIKCNGPKGHGKCVVEMDGQESMGGTIACDIAEDLEFREDDILAFCEFASDDDCYWFGVEGLVKYLKEERMKPGRRM